MSTDPTDPAAEQSAESAPAAEGDTPAEQLTDEIARKYDPERLLKMVNRKAGRGHQLDHSVRAKYERRFGVDLGHVRIYTGEFAEEFNRKRSAYAVTIGSTGMILMGGSPDKSMGSHSGQALLAHELTHVAQSKRGLHNKNFDGAMPLATEEHEEEAEMIEAEIMAGGDLSGALGGLPSNKLLHVTAEKKQKDAEELERAREKVMKKVMDDMAEEARGQSARNQPARH